MLAAVKNGQALVNVNGITCIFSTVVGLVRVRLIRALMLQSEARGASTERVHCFFLLYTCLNFTKEINTRFVGSTSLVDGVILDSGTEVRSLIFLSLK